MWGTQYGTAGRHTEIRSTTSGSTATNNLHLDTNGNERLRLASNGDISFYEDTGTTAKFFWDASAESLGIGTTSPFSKLHVGTRGTASVLTYSSAGDGIVFDFYNVGNPYTRQANIISSSADTSESRLGFWTQAASGTSSQKLTILGNGNVGIGTASPLSEFHVKGDADTIARIEPNNNSGKGTLLVSSAASGDGGMQYDSNANRMYLFSYGDMTFNVGTGNLSGNYPANERLRILSGGGVTFNGDTAAANALDDYEEGTWTPVVTSTAGTLTTVSGTGTYTKIGRSIYIDYNILIPANGTGSAAIKVAGLPHNLSSYRGFGVGRETDVVGFLFGSQAIGGTDYFILNKYDGTYPAGTSYRLQGSFSYKT